MFTNLQLIINDITKLLFKRIKYLNYILGTLILLPLGAYLLPVEIESFLLPLTLIIHITFLIIYLFPNLKPKIWLVLGFFLQTIYFFSKLNYVFAEEIIFQDPAGLITVFLPWSLFLVVWLQFIFTKPVRSLIFSIGFYLITVFIVSEHLLHSFTVGPHIPWLNIFLGLSFFNLIICNMFAFLKWQEKNIFSLDLPTSYDALRDPLTQLPNRMAFLSHLSRTLRLRKKRQKVAVFIVDLDQLKPINDSLGHLVGDEVLKKVAQRLESSLLFRDKSMVSRLGGDEYAIFVYGIKHIEEATQQAQKMIQGLQVPFEIAGQDLIVTASIGLSLAPSHGEDNQSLLSKADKAMYHAKALGKNCYQVFIPDMDKDTAERLTLKRRFKEAFENHKLELYYQPIIELAQEQVTHFEVLLRWYDDQLGQVPPSEFIPLAEETGLIIPLGKWVLKKACKACQVWQEAGYSNVGVSVNISTLQLMQANFANHVAKSLQGANLKAECLLLEITESSVIQNRAEEQMHKIKNLNVKISLDDFGTGYASFAQLKYFSVDFLKIDQSFIFKLGDTKVSSYSDNFIRTIIQFCKSQGIKVIAEGVETQTHLNLLRQAGCDEVQGNFISKPLPFKELRSFLEDPKQNYIPRLPDSFAALTFNKLGKLFEKLPEISN